MRKIKLLLEYDGTAFEGWQIQKKGSTIQGILEDRIVKVTGEQSRVIGASRTDAGVHALGQVAAFRTGSRLDTETIRRALNALLPVDIRILETSEVSNSFHPRYSSLRKSYFYVIANQRESSVFFYKYVYTIRQPLDLKLMTEALPVLAGKHDFSSFKGSGSCSRNPVREIFSLNIERFEKFDFLTLSVKGNFIKIRIEADSFLRHMVRNIVGTLVEVGRGKFSPDKVKEILESRDRRRAGPTAPPNGLFLEKIIY
ncbi:MAG: tRNA pseudouridine(38-40) synthase TruA [Nitrospirota bacterium]